MRSCRWGVLAGAVLALALAAPAQAARVVTWKLTSRYVDPAGVVFAQPPVCVCTPHAADHLPVNVYLPDGYDGRRRFPVLYLLHGSPLAYDSWLTVPSTPYGRGPDLMRFTAGFPGIIVMPDGGAFGWYVDWWNGGRRGDPAWERYFLDQLIATVDRRLRVLPGRRSHVIAGHSMGGYGATVLAAERPGYFGAAATLSGALSSNDVDPAHAREILGDQVAQAFYRAGHDPATLAPNLRWTRLFVAVGDGVLPAVEEAENGGLVSVEGTVERTINGQAREFVAAARRAGAAVRFEVKPGIHTHSLLRRELPDALAWVRDAFRAPAPEHPRRWTYRTVAQRGEVFGFRYAFARPPGVLVTFRRDGRRLSASGRGTVHVRTPDGRRFTATLPFTRTVRIRA